MRVAILLEHKSPLLGGGFTFQEDLLRALVRLRRETRHEFVLFCDPAYVDDHFGALLQGADIEVVPERRGNFLERALLLFNRRSPTVQWLRRWVALPTRLDRILRQRRIDLVWFLSMRAELLDVPYFAVVWDLQHRVQPWFPELSSRGEWERRESLSRWFLRRAARVVVGTRLGAEELERFYQVAPERILHLPHPTPEFAAQAGSGGADVLSRHALEPGFLLYPAQFWAHKNHVNLLHALEHLRRVRGKAPQLVLVGSDRGNRRFVEEQVRALGLEERVRILGFVSREELIALYRRAGALAYLSFCGPENLPPLEAFALGCPVVSARYPGAEEQLGDAALLVDPTDPPAIAAAIEQALGDARAGLIERGRARATRWTADDFVRGIFRALDDFEPVRRCWPAG